MNGIVIPLQRRADRQHTMAQVTRGPTPDAAPDPGTILLNLRGKQRELLAVIEGLRAETMRGASAVTPLVADLDILACRTLANIDFLIHSAENMAETEEKA